MKIYKFMMMISIAVIFTLLIGAISAAEDSNDNTTAVDDSINDIDTNILESSNDDVLSESPKTIVVPFDRYNPNEVLLPKIQPAIDGANPGDTIIIEGNPVHCHLTINKRLNIVAGEGTTIDACPHHTHEGLEEYGVFYITAEGSGSTIQGFTFTNKDKSKTPFSILIDGASDVTIKDCTMDYVNENADKITGIIVRNSNNIKLSNLIVNNTINGITIINSSNVEITDCILSYNDNYGVTVVGNSRNVKINSNSIRNNGKSGINLTVADYVYVTDNLIENNGLENSDSGSGIYVNTNVTKLVVTGNIFISNGLHAIMYDYRARNLDNSEGADQLTIVDCNYFEGHSSMILHHRIYVERSYGTMAYDEANDIFFPSDNGNYVEGKTYVYMQRAFIYQDVPCGFTYYTTQIPWAVEAPNNNGKYDLSLRLGEIRQTSNGVYQVSIVDSKGNVATIFNSGYVTFFLNEYSTIEPQENNVYKKVLIQNGVATADFRSSYASFKTSGNVVTAAFNGLSDDVERNPNSQFNVSDSNIPISPATKIIATKLTTFPLSDSYFSAKLVDSKGNPIANQKVSIKFNGKTYNVKTDAQGIAKVKVSLTTKKTYAVTIAYGGDDNHNSAKLTSSIVVKTGSKKSKIKASSFKVKKNKKKTFKLKLTTSAGKAIKSQKIIVKLNGKTYTLKTNKKGIAKLSIKLKKVKTYKVSMKFLGNANFKASSKTVKVIVKK